MIRFLFVSIVFAAPLLAQPADQLAWQRGVGLYQAERYAQARDAFRDFVKLRADAGAGWGLLGLCEFETGEYGPAADHLLKAIDTGVGEIPALAYQVRLRAGLLLTRFGRFDAALNLLLHFSREGKNTPSVIEAVGLAALQIPKLPAELTGEERDVVTQAGLAVFESGAARAESAARKFRNLVERYGSRPGVHFLYGKFLSLSQPENAVPEFLKELEISPCHAPARVHLALEHLKNGEPEKARSYAKQAAALSPADFTTRYVHGRACFETGDAVAAIAELEAAVRLAPYMPEAHFQLARAYASAGRPRDAERERQTFARLKASERPPA